MPETAAAGGGAVERLLRREILVTLGCLGVLAVIAWLYTVFGVGMDMSATEMTRMARSLGAPMPMAVQPEWSLAHVALVFLMWWVMMIAMMVPSAAPLVLLFAAVNRRGQSGGATGVLSAFLLAGYLGVWGGFSALATAAQYGAEAAGWLNGAMMTLDGSRVAGGLLVLAGLYQLTPVKTACLRRCRSPGQVLARHNRPGRSGAFRMGIVHGMFCLGCCWGIMALLFAGGVMNLVWIAGLTAYVMAERFLPGGQMVAKAGGVVLVLVGGGVAVG